MKKILIAAMTLVLSIVLTLGLVSCGSDTEKKDKKSEADSKAAVEYHSVEAIKDRGELVVAIHDDTDKYILKGEDGSYSGYGYEMAAEIAEALGVELKIDNLNSMDNVFKALRNGDADMTTCNYVRTEARQRDYAVSDNCLDYTYWEKPTKQEVFALKEDSGAYTSMDAYKGKTIACIKGSVQMELCEKLLTESTIKKCKDKEACVKAVREGEADVIVPFLWESDFASQYTDFAACAYALPYEDPGWGILMMKGNKSLQSFANEQIKAVLSDGRMHQWAEATYQ